MEALSHYLRALADPEIPVSLSDVEQLMKDYPFFTLPALTLMQREGNVLPDQTRQRLLEQIALNAPDPAAFAALSDPDREAWTNFYPSEKKAKVTTEDVIDTFLATYGHSSPQENALLERLIFNPTADYSMILAKEESEGASSSPEPRTPQASAPAGSQDALIEAFINREQPDGLKEQSEGQKISEQSQLSEQSEGLKTSEQSQLSEQSAPQDDSDNSYISDPSDNSDNSDPSDNPASSDNPAPLPTPTDHPVAVVSEAPSDTSLSESLAKIYIRRRRYDKAFEIIHSLSLNNPKKSVYFADQLRFLRKLMLNSSLNEQK